MSNKHLRRGPVVEHVYLLHTQTEGSPWYLVTAHGNVMLSGVTSPKESDHGYVRGYIAGINAQTASRKELIKVDYVLEELPEAVFGVVKELTEQNKEEDIRGR